MIPSIFKFVLLAGLASTAWSRTIHARKASTSPIVDLGYSKYLGARLNDDSVDEYLGMRYARPPFGDLRFRAPQEPLSNDTIQDASRFGPICTGITQPSATIGEDCLFVNVFKPSNASINSKLPVWIYIQGGGYRSNSNANYNGTDVVQKSGYNVVFVNFNYRVGPLGFLASERVRQDGDLNAGLLDQRMVLKWVQKYINLFGGDPSHVVLHGASAGGGSVSHHLVADHMLNESNFIGAIPENPFWPTLRTVEQMKFQFDILATQAGCSSEANTTEADPLACLRDVPLSDLITAAATYYPFPDAYATNSTSPSMLNTTEAPLWYWLPVIDSYLIPDTLYTSFQAGHFARVPLLVGDDTNEGTSFAPNATNSSEVLSFFHANYPHLTPDQLSAIAEAYPLSAYPTLAKHANYFPVAAAAYGDATFTCPGNALAFPFAGYVSPNTTWTYRYNVLDAGNVANGVGVPHTFETSAIFGPGYVGSTAASYYSYNSEIVPVVMGYFLSFVMYLDPNVGRVEGSPEWEGWGGGEGRRLRLETNRTGMEDVPEELGRNCALWEGLRGVMQV